MRNGLLGSTALIAAAFAASGAMAQTTIVAPSGGGVITRTTGSNPSVTNQTAGGGGIVLTGVSQSTDLTVNGVQINNTTGTPTANALEVRGLTGGLNSTGVLFTGASGLTTTTSGGSAFFAQTNANMGVTFASGGSVFTGSYGLNLNAPSGYVSLDSTGYNQSFVGNGSAVAGINILSAINAGISIGGSSITGFDTGVNATNLFGSGFVSTGGVINATSTGIRLNATGGQNSVDSQSAITALTGIHSTAVGNVTDTTTIITRGAGTINSTAIGTGTGVLVASAGKVNVTIGADLGLGSHFATGISAVSASGITGNQININAHTRGVTGVATGAGAFVTTVGASGEINGMTAGGFGVDDFGGGSIINNGNIYAQGTGVRLQAGGSVTNNSTLTGAGGTAIALTGSDAATVTLANGSTTTGTIVSTGSGARNLTLAGIFDGALDATGATGAVNLTVNTSATGYNLLRAGTGADSLTFAGTGTRSFSVDNLGGWETGAFTGGNWTLTGTGNQTSFTSGLTINGAALSISDTLQLQGATSLTMTGGGSITTTSSISNTRGINLSGAGSLGVAASRTLTQSGVVSGAGTLTLNGPGTLILSGNNTYTGGTVVNSGILQLASTTAAGTGVIRMIDPQINFAASGTYNNAISLEVADGQQAADPTILNNTSGGTVTLAGRIYETTGVGGANQYVTFSGGTFSLTNNTNSWGGVSRINSGSTVMVQSGGVNGLSGGSIVNNGTLYYLNNTAGTVAQAISGSGAIQIGSTAPVTFSGALTTTGTFEVSGGAASAVIAGSRSGANGTAAVVSGANSSLSVANGGSIVGGGQLGVHMYGIGSTLSNLGSITNSGVSNAIGAAVYVQATSGTNTVNNGSSSDTGAGSIIRGYNAGIRHDLSTGGLLVVNNYGHIRGDIYNGIENSTGGLTVNNFSGGYIWTLLGNGISSNSTSAVSVTNAGIIGRDPTDTTTVGSYAVTTNGVLTLNNQAGGQMHGTLGGVQSNAAGASITNAGTITGNSGILLASGGSVTNQGGGIILGTNGYGIDSNAGLILNNSGIIRSVGGAGTAVDTLGVSTLTNNAGGVIAGQFNGLTLAGGINTVVNNGVIAGFQNGVSGSAFSHGITNSGVIVAGYVTDATTTLAQADRSSVPVTAYGVNLTSGGTVTNLAGGAIAGRGAGVRLTNGGTVTNAGLIDSDGVATADAGIRLVSGGTVSNQLGGVITGNVNGIRSDAGTVSVNNAGSISGGVEGLLVFGQLGLTNTGSINGQTYAGVTFDAASSVDNYGSITSTGGFYGLYNASTSGTTTITNRSGGLITGAMGGILLNAGTTVIDLQAGSTTGRIVSNGAGTRTASLAGDLTGDFDMSSNTGVDTVTLAATGSMTNALLGGGADTFTWQGGSFSGSIDGGAASDNFISALGGASASLNLSNVLNFETLNHLSGTATLTGNGSFSGGTAVQGGTLIVNGALQSLTSVSSGATLSGGGSITDAVMVLNGGILANTQGSTLTMGSLSLNSGSAINATFNGAGGPALFAVTGNLTLDGTVNIASTGAFGMGVYGLMTYGGALTDNGLLIGTTAAGTQRLTVQTSVAGQVNLVHAPNELLFWDGGNAGQHNNNAVNGGSGVWTAAGSNWTDANGLFNGAMTPQPGFAIFQGVGGTVTVDDSAGAVGVTGMQFAANGYTVQGDALTLAAPSTTVRVGDGTAGSAGWSSKIASALVGSGGLVKTDLGTLILTGENSYTGSTTVNAGVLRVGNGAGAGSFVGSAVLANGAGLTFSRNDHHSFSNAVSGTGSVTVDGIAALTGAITASGGVSVTAGSTATLSDVSIAGSNAVLAGTAATVNVAAGGTISSLSGTAIWAQGATGTINNAGSVTGGGTGVAIFASGALTLANTPGGSILGHFAVSANGDLNLTNAGSISASIASFNNSGIYAGGQGTITNTGSILSGTNAIYTQGRGDLTNSGLIRGGGAASTVRFVGANATVNNSATGEINTTGTGTGVYLDGANASVTNAGLIRGGNAVWLVGGGTLTNSGMLTGSLGSAVVSAGGSVSNLADGAINGVSNGVNFNVGGGSVTNAGSITGTGANGIIFNAGGSLTNTGTISGALQGVRSLAGLGLTSSGTITGTGGTAVESVGAFSDSLTFLAGSTTNGAILSGDGADTISLAGVVNGLVNAGDGADTVTLFDTGSVSGLIDGGAGVDAFILDGAGAGSLNIGNVVNFESRAKTGAGVWTLTGVDAAAVDWAVNGGVLAVSGGSAIHDSASVGIGAGGTLRLLGEETIGGLSGSGLVDLGLNASLTIGGGSSSYAGVIGGTAGNVAIASGATLGLGGANTYTGTTSVLGTLRLDASDVLSDLSTLTIAAGGAVDMQAFNDTVVRANINGALNGTGTLTAGQYVLNGGTVNANLGAGLLTQAGGASVLNGAAAAGTVFVTGGTLALGASERLSDAATLFVDTGAVLDLGAFNETVGVASLVGTLNGSGTLTAAEIELNGATVNANLGAGRLVNFSGVSTLNGTSAAGTVVVADGTLVLGAADRLSDAATVSVASGSVLDLGAFNETVGLLGLSGALNGTGTLTAGRYELTGATVNANLGAGDLVQLSGSSVLNGTSASQLISVAGGTLGLGAANRLSDTATVVVGSGAALNLGAFNETVGLLGLSGALSGTGTLTAGRYELTGATVNANLGAGDLVQVSGSSVLNGTSASQLISVAGGTLGLGAANRLSDTATVVVGSGAALNLGAFNETVGLLGLSGALSGTGTLTAGRYELTGATVNANLGAGDLVQVSGSSVLNGTSASQLISVAGGTLGLGAANRLSDTATVVVGANGALNLGAFSETVGLLGLSGTLNGTGTLTAAETQLTGATVNANLAGDRLFNMSGVSTLNGTAAQSLVSVQGGTLRLGASERLSDTATVSVSQGATLALGAWMDRIGSLYGMGDVTVGSAGRLTVSGESGFGGRLSGAGALWHTGGLFTLLGDHSIGSIVNQGGELRFVGSTTGTMSIAGGSLTGGGTIGGNLVVSSGGVLSPGLSGQQNGIGGFTVGGLTLTGGRLNLDVTGTAAGNLIDQIRVLGTATLTGGTVAPTFQGGVTDFNFATRYLFVQADRLVGAFSNGSEFTAAQQNGLYWRVRYDLMPNSAVIELRQLTDFGPGATGSDNQRAVGDALTGGQINASDDYAAVLSVFVGLSDAERKTALDNISGEALTDVTTSAFAANDHFLQTVQAQGFRGDESGRSLSFASQLSLSSGANTPAGQLAGVLSAYDPGAAQGGAQGGWVSVFAGDQRLEGKAGQATVDSRINGFAGGYGVSRGDWTIGGAAGVSRMEGDVVARGSSYESDISHGAAFARYDDGQWVADLTGVVYGGDADTWRSVAVGALRATAIGNTHAEGQALSASVSRRYRFADEGTLAFGMMGTVSNASVDGYTETGAGVLSLQVSGQERDWQTLQLSARATQPYEVDGRTMRIYGGLGVLATTGDRQTTGDMRFTGAPTGFGSFAIEGAETPPLAGVTDFGLEVEAADGVSVSAGYRGVFSERLTENQIGMKLNVRW
ncbi:autotransporter-associated beta strand repeat-containing protein [Brevundimonas kwangchunensis]|uniref:Autotransporter-associated beta strand repeat-containing protein n=2 Tax=Brevundimonas kwangchunensis TaxID=322163 RepID=A0ABP3S4F3_9CAUL